MIAQQQLEINSNIEVDRPNQDSASIKKAPNILSLERLRELRIVFSCEIKDLSDSRLLQMMGMLNCYSWSIAKRWNAVIEKEAFGEMGLNKTWEADPSRLKELASGCLDGKAELTVAGTWTSWYLVKFWKGACSSRPSINRMRDFMRDRLALFSFQNQIGGTTATPPELKYVDFIGMLVAFEVCEKELLSRQRLPDGEAVGSELEYCLPKHKGAMMVAMFNAVFEGIAEYGRVLPIEQFFRIENPIVELPECGEPPEHKITWTWNYCKTIARKIWINLMKKHARITGRIYHIDKSEPVNWEKVERETNNWMQEQYLAWEIPY